MWKLPAILTTSSWKQAQPLVEKIVGKKGTGIDAALGALNDHFHKIDWDTIARADEAPRIPLVGYNGVRSLAAEVNKALVGVVNSDGAAKQLVAVVSAYLPVFQASKAEGAKQVASYLSGVKKAASDIQKLLAGTIKEATGEITKELARRGPLAATQLPVWLAKSDLRIHFRAFAKEQYSQENIDFYMAIQSGMSKAVFDKYVKDDDVNLPGKVREALTEAVEKKDWKGAAWAAARNEAMNNMVDTFSRFITS